MSRFDNYVRRLEDARRPKTRPATKDPEAKRKWETYIRSLAMLNTLRDRGADAQVEAGRLVITTGVFTPHPLLGGPLHEGILREIEELKPEIIRILLKRQERG